MIDDKSLPPPLVPADVDLRGLEYMPLMGHHLFGSDFNTTNNDAAWRAGVTLWWAAWNQKPAGSLPDDDEALCRLAQLGRDVKAWKPLREIALRNFVKCSDGRLYHPFLCKQALVAWDKRVKERKRKADYRAKKDAEREGQGAVGPNAVPRDKTRTETGTGRGPDADVPPVSPLTGRDVTGRDVKTLKPEAAHSDGTTEPPLDAARAASPESELPPQPGDPEPALTRHGEIAVLLRSLGVVANSMHPTVHAWAISNVPDHVIREAVDIAQVRKPGASIGPAYLAPIVADLLNPKPVRESTPAWWTTEEGTKAKGRELGIEAWPGEEMPQFKARINAAIQQRDREQRA